MTSFESPVDNYIGRITTTSDIIWLDDRFRKRPLLSYKHYRSFDRTLRVTTANCGGGMFLPYLANVYLMFPASLSLLTSRRNGLVSLYDVSRGTDGLLHCNSNPFCLPQAEPVFMAYNGDALVALPSNERLMFLRLCRRGSIYRQDIGVARSLDEDQPGSLQHNHVTHRWDEDILTLEKCASELQSDFGPAGGRHFSEVNFRGAYESMSYRAQNQICSYNQQRYLQLEVMLKKTWMITRSKTCWLNYPTFGKTLKILPRIC